MEHRRIRVLVRRDVQTAGASVFDLGNEAIDRPPVLACADLEVEQVHRELGLFRHPDREVDLLLLLVALAAVVRGVVPTVRGNDLGQLEDLCGVLRPAAREPRHETPGTFLHRPGREPPHAI